jgi:hypothetical protein
VVAQVRAQRRENLLQILRPTAERGELALPLEDALALAFTLTAHSTWQTLVRQVGLTTARAITLVTGFLEKLLFEPGNGKASNGTASGGR